VAANTLPPERMSTIASTDRPHGLNGMTARLRAHAPEIAFAALLVLGAALVLVETRGLSFFLDDWDFVLRRRGLSPGVLLQPHGPHLSLLPILVYKAILQVFGASYLPFRLLAAFDLVLIAGVLGWVCRSLWGRWWGLAPVLLLVTLGPGAPTLLWSFQVGFAFALAAGVVALVAAGRGDGTADIVCCVALVVSLASGSAGAGFAVGAAVIVAIRDDRWRRSWVVLVPLALYGLWYLKYGHQHSETHLSLWKQALPYSMQALATTSAAVAGLSSTPALGGPVDAPFGVPIAIAIVATVAAGIWRGWRPSPLFWGAAAALITMFVAACLSNGPPDPRPANASRYVSTDAMVLFICACAALPRPRPRRAGVILACVALAVVSLTNASQYGLQHHLWAQSDAISRAELGGLLVLRGTVRPAFDPHTPTDPAALVLVQAQPFYDAVDAFGLHVDSPSSLRRQPEYIRELVDGLLQRGGLSLVPAAAQPGGVPGRCVVVGPAPFVFRARPGTYRLTAGRSAMTVSGGRFGDAYSAHVGSVAPSTSADLTVKRDRASGIPWRIEATGAGGQVCPAS
jgi:hypothetical protein